MLQVILPRARWTTVAGAHAAVAGQDVSTRVRTVERRGGVGLGHAAAREHRSRAARLSPFVSRGSR